MIRLNVFIQVEAAKHAQLLDAAKELTACSLKEEGCIAYDIFESATRSDILLICETWSNESSLKAHEATEPFTRLLGKIQELGKVKLEKFNF